MVVHEHNSWKADCIATPNRTDAVLLAPPTVRTHTAAHFLDPTYPLCKEKSQTLENWLQRWPNLDVFRQHTFGNPLSPLGVLTTDPEKVLALARATS